MNNEQTDLKIIIKDSVNYGHLFIGMLVGFGTIIASFVTLMPEIKFLSNTVVLTLFSLFIIFIFVLLLIAAKKEEIIFKSNKQAELVATNLITKKNTARMLDLSNVIGVEFYNGFNEKSIGARMSVVYLVFKNGDRAAVIERPNTTAGFKSIQPLTQEPEMIARHLDVPLEAKDVSNLASAVRHFPSIYEASSRNRSL